MPAPDIIERIANNPRLPTFPAVTMQVLQKTSRPDCSLKEIGELIRLDPALCGRILKIVNSALFGLSQPVTSVERTLGLLGLRRVRSLVLGASLGTIGRNVHVPWLPEYWRASVVGAITARELALRLGHTNADADTELVAGLLRDLGMLVLQETCGKQYAPLFAYSPEELACNQCELEEKLLDVNHAELSADLLQRWHLPVEITQPILCHHHPDRASQLGANIEDRAYFLFFSTLVAQLQSPNCPQVIVDEMVELADSRFNMNADQLEQFLEPLSQMAEQLASLLQIPMAECRQHPALVKNATEQLAKLAFETNLDNLRLREQQKQAEEERKKVEENLRRTEEQFLQVQKMDAVGRLVGGVAHDFNNLLMVISGFSEMLLYSLPKDHSGRGLVDQIRKASERASELTRQLLAFSRKNTPKPVIVNLNETIGHMEKMLRRLIGEDVKLVTILQPQLRVVMADPGQMEQVLLNLAVNARDAMPTGGQLTIQTADIDLDETFAQVYPEMQPGPYACLAVTDSGHGMNDDVKAHLFEPFFTTKEPGKGTGLGLTTIYGIVKQCRGHISVHSQMGYGTSFKIYLPSNQGAAPAAAESDHLPELPPGTETILLVEDEEAVRRITRQILEKKGYQVLEASQGEQALSLGQAHAGPIHLLLTDTVMPEMGGAQLAQLLQQTRPDLKVLYMSGYPDDVVVRQGVSSGASNFLSKPFISRALEEKVRQVLHQSET